jgi:phosphoribosylformylglycinamidine synthase PurS subunit
VIYATTNFKLQTANFLRFAHKFLKMKFNIQVKVMPLKELLDPQGKAVMTGLGNLGFKNVGNVRIGKNINLEVDASSKEEAQQIAEEASKKLLANPVMEYYEIEII